MVASVARHRGRSAPPWCDHPPGADRERAGQRDIHWEYDITLTNVEAGEDIRWLPRRRASDLLLPGNDFWVFDDRLVLWNHFTGEGEVSPEGWEVTEDPAQVKACMSAFESVWDRAVPHGDYRPA